ncbi:hypothetical protein DH2020_046437 [Rehmannia glutinosa]|uniref:Protein kinase domain-containing protein n=1 Tax=Rehmannia glutinosa TaxID=99300 RepID=A0ABR0UB89_REHGL
MEKFFLELAQENPVRFTAQQLFAFTDNYNTVLGSGGFGRVYKGQFPNGVKIAVKVLNRGPNRNIEEQFMAEVGTIGRTHHINLVRLYGFCYDHFMSALVYEFMENGSLDRHLFSENQEFVYEFMENGSLDRHLFSENQELEWSQLHEIAVGTAKGIAYLHEECQHRIIHYDIKPGNVLLDGKFSPKYWKLLLKVLMKEPYQVHIWLLMEEELISQHNITEEDIIEEEEIIEEKVEEIMEIECIARSVLFAFNPSTMANQVSFTKVADFGLAKLVNRDDTHISNTGYRGTPGYLAPKFLLKNFPITYKCDVYNFGILLFEIVGRRKNTKDRGNSDDSLDWFPKKVWEEFEKEELMKLTEVCGIEEKDRVKAQRMAMVALWCAQDSPNARPPMSAVVKMLEGGVEIVPPPKPFHYLFSVGTNVLKPPSGSESGSGYSTSDETNSYWCKETTTPIMAKYEISVATL